MYVAKSDDPSVLIDAIRTVARGEFACGEKVLEHCETNQPATSRTAPSTKTDRLTAREIEILRLIGKGMSRAEIADALHRSPKTIDNHRAAIMEKLGIHRTIELARFAIAEGLAEPE